MTRTLVKGLALAAVPLGGLAAAIIVFLTAQGGDAPVPFLEGVPVEYFEDAYLKPAPEHSLVALPSQSAIDKAFEVTRAARTAPIRQVILLEFANPAMKQPYPLVWAVNFANPADAWSGFCSRDIVEEATPGPVECQPDYVIVLINANTGEHVMTMESYKPLDPTEAAPQ
jgi:hypothetical protein